MKKRVFVLTIILSALFLLALHTMPELVRTQSLSPNDLGELESETLVVSEIEETVLSEISLVASTDTGVQPSDVEAGLLCPGDSIEVTKTVATSEILPKPDIYFLSDSTGSMGGAIANVQANAATILNTVSGVANDPQFGAGNYKDFPYDSYAFQNNASIGDAATALAGIGGWSASGGADGSEAQLYALDRIADNVVGFRTDSSKIVVWFGDWPGHDPVCSAISGLGYDITENSVTNKLVAAGIRVIAISVSTNYSNFDVGCTNCDLDGDPQLDAYNYSGYCAIGGSSGQASRIATATGGVYFANVSPDQVSTKILEGLTALPVTVSPQLRPGCSGELSYSFSPLSQTITSGETATFTETITVDGSATGGCKTCVVDWLLNGVYAGPEFEQYIEICVDTPPVAQCKDVTVPADENCQAYASIDDGSYDPDGDTITLSQDPPGPYELGDTTVTLTVTGGCGATDTCTATVTVVDITPPEVQCNSPATITPNEAPISFTATATDNCGVESVVITGYDCWWISGSGKTKSKLESCIVEVTGDTITILDSGGIDDHITWTVVATDTSGNVTEVTCEVIVVNPGLT